MGGDGPKGKLVNDNPRPYYPFPWKSLKSACLSEAAGDVWEAKGVTVGRLVDEPRDALPGGTSCVRPAVLIGVKARQPQEFADLL
jgi:hypothetical protein